VSAAAPDSERRLRVANQGREPTSRGVPVVEVQRDGRLYSRPIWHRGLMRSSVAAVHRLVAALEPWDDLEAQHQAETLRWLEDTDDVFRRSKPATPDPHLVTYVVMVDPDDGSSVLVDHISASLWLPPGGHVEPDEHPADTARRELHEELGVDPALLRQLKTPTFLTVTQTVGPQPAHTDVSLWFVVPGHRNRTLQPDLGEFRSARWWTPAEVLGQPSSRFDPHYGRFASKVCR
jgi:8-oxo-dGTP diphosphatase